MLEANVSSPHLGLTTVRTAVTQLLQAACVIVLLVLIGALCAALVPRPLGYRPVVVTSGSMGHAIPMGSVAMTHSVGAGGIRVGDVILIRAEADGVDARPKMHRVVTVEHDDTNTLVSTKGDANDAPDPNLYVLPARVDVVAYSMPYLGYLVGLILTPAGWVLLVGLPGLLVCGVVLRRIWASEDPSPRAEQRVTGAAAKREHAGAARVPQRLTGRAPQASFLTIALALVALTAFTVASVAYVTVPRATTNDESVRLTREVVSLTQHSSRLATSDAYAADLALLRDTDDPLLRATDRATQEAALRRLVDGATNVFDAMAVIDPDGHVIASTDPTIADVHASAAFLFSRANGGVATSVALPGTVDYAAPLRAPDGSLTGVLFARVAAGRLWAPALSATVDGSRTVIIDGDGTLIAGVAPDALGSNWSAAPADLGGMHASIDGVASVCDSSAIGEGTHLDMGWRVASCLPASLATAGSTASLRRYNVSLAVATATAVLVASIVLYAAARLERARRGRNRSPQPQEPTGIEAFEARLHALEG